jgi:prophage DNA circulation protein
MKKTKDNTQTGKNSKNERIRACMDELKHLLAMTKHEHAMLVDLCELAHPTCRESMRVALLASLAKDVEMLFGSYYDKVIARGVMTDTGMESDESLDAIIEHTQNQIVDYMSIRGGVVSKPELMFVFGESEMTRDALDSMIDDEKIAVVNGEFTTIGYYFPKA